MDLKPSRFVVLVPEIPSYSSERYDVYITTNLVENQLFNFYSNKKIKMSIIKKIKSRVGLQYMCYKNK